MSEPTLAELGFSPASMDYTEFEGGRPDKFRGYTDSGVCFPYKGKTSKDGKYGLVIAYHIIPDPDSGFEPFWEILYGAGRLSKCVPSKDGSTPAGATIQQYMQLAAGRTTLEPPVIGENGAVNVNHENCGPFALGTLAEDRSAFILYKSIRESDKNGIIQYPPPKGNLNFINDVWMRFDRVPTKYEDSAGKEQTRYDLQVTQVFEKVDNAGTTKKKTSTTNTATTSAASAKPSNGSTIGNDIISEIMKYLVEIEGGPVHEDKLMNEIAKRMKNTEYKRIQIMSWIMEKDANGLPVNLGEIDGTTYDTKEKTLAIE